MASGVAPPRDPRHGGYSPFLTRMNIVVIGLSHRSAPVKLRERFAFADGRIPGALQALRDSGLAAEAAILSTCNRVEIYAATALAPDAACAALKNFLVQQSTIGRRDSGLECGTPLPLSDAAVKAPEDWRTPKPAGSSTAPVFSDAILAGDEIYFHAEPHSLQHLFKVAAGLDSMVIGETEIFGQLKDAYELAFTHRHTGARLNKAFQRAFNVAKHIRTATNIQRGSVSVMSAAVELAEKIFSSLAEHEVLVIGAGETSEKTARALLSRGARGVIVTNRSPERATALAAELGGRAVPFACWPEEFEQVDIAISSTAAPQPILDRAQLEPLMKRRKHRPLLLIDIAVPRDIDPAVSALDNVYLYNVDDLQVIANEYLALRQEEVARCETIIAAKVAALLAAKPPLAADEPS
jgi:glutamyl-tRNA reductase